VSEQSLHHYLVYFEAEDGFQFELSVLTPFQIGETIWPRSGLCQRCEPYDKSIFRVKAIHRTVRQLAPEEMMADMPSIELELVEKR